MTTTVAAMTTTKSHREQTNDKKVCIFLNCYSVQVVFVLGIIVFYRCIEHSYFHILHMLSKEITMSDIMYIDVHCAIVCLTIFSSS